MPHICTQETLSLINNEACLTVVVTGIGDFVYFDADRSPFEGKLCSYTSLHYFTIMSVYQDLINYSKKLEY